MAHDRSGARPNLRHGSGRAETAVKAILHGAEPAGRAVLAREVGRAPRHALPRRADELDAARHAKLAALGRALEDSGRASEHAVYTEL